VSDLKLGISKFTLRHTVRNLMQNCTRECCLPPRCAVSGFYAA